MNIETNALLALNLTHHPLDVRGTGEEHGTETTYSWKQTRRRLYASRMEALILWSPSRL